MGVLMLISIRLYIYTARSTLALLLPLILNLSLTTVSTGPAFADPASLFAGGVVVNEALDEAESDLMEKGRIHADYLMFMFGQRMAALVREARTQAGDVLDQTFDSLEEERQDIFRQIDELYATAESDMAGAIDKADELLSNFAQTTVGIPFVDRSARLFTVSPAILPPTDVETIVKFMGPNWGISEATATLPDGKKVPLIKSREAESYLKLTPLDFAAADGVANFIEIEVSYVRYPGDWYLLWLNSSEDKITTPILVPRKVPGKVRLIETFEKEVLDYTTFEVTLNQIARNHVGPHPVTVPPALKEQGWTMDVAKLQASTTGGYNLLPRGTYGHSGSCNGVKLDTLSRDGFTYLIWTGDTTHGFDTDPGNQSCPLTVPLERKTVTEEVVATEFFNLSWVEPVVLTPSAGAKSRKLELHFAEGDPLLLDEDESTSRVSVVTDPAGSLIVKPALPRGL
jgi:hypothetical protein